MPADEELEQLLKRRTRFARLVHTASCGSTQTLAMEMLAEGSAGAGDAVFWADHQTAGRGRQQRFWDDRPGLDLAATFRVSQRLPEPLALPAALPVAVVEACEPFAGRRLRIKWPNDVFADGQKVAGVLIDRDSRDPDTYRIGVGVNVNRTGFPRDLDGRATSLALLTGREHDRARLLLALAERVDAMLEALSARRHEQLEEVFRDRLGLLGERVEADAGQPTSGRLTAIDFERLELDGTRSVPRAIVRSLRAARR